ncbi:MAG TPA: hypothetical protein VH561_13375 [Micromonosporaceae bacterium]|jgi:hypothetical protein
MQRPAGDAPTTRRRYRGLATVAISAGVVAAASLALMTGTAIADNPPTPTTYTPTPSVFVHNNVKSCDLLQLETIIGKVDPPVDTDDGNGNSVDVSADGKSLIVTIADGFTVDAIVVKGTDDSNVYFGPFVGPAVVTGLVAPAAGDSTANISHFVICGSGSPVETTTTEPPTTEPPTTEPPTTEPPTTEPPTTEPPTTEPPTTEPPSTEPPSTEPPRTTTTFISPSRTTLPKTGMDVSGSMLAGMVALGSGLIALGATVLLVLRRWRDRTAS